MSNNINLCAGLRTSLLALQNIQSDMNVLQARLATGFKVNSAIDNPNSYYVAKALNYRAGDLSALLDAMSEGIQTIVAANEAIDSGNKLLQQAKAVTTQALQTVNPDTSYTPPPAPIKIAATVDSEQALLDAIANTSADDGVIVVTKDLTFTDQTLKLADGQKIVGQNYIDGSGKTASLTFNFTNSIAFTSGVDDDNAHAIALSNDSLLSDLTINYSAAKKKDSKTNHCLFNNGKTGIVLRNLNVNATCTVTNNGYMGAIRNIGNGIINLEGTVNISATGGKQVCGIASIQITDTSVTPQIIQAAGSVLNITTSSSKGSACYGISGGHNTFNGIVNIVTNAQASAGLYVAENKIYGTMNVTTLGSASDAAYNCKNTYYDTSTTNIKTSSGSGIYAGSNTFYNGSKLMVELAKNSDYVFKSAPYSIESNVTFGTKQTGGANGLWLSNAASTRSAANISDFDSNAAFVKQSAYPDGYVWQTDFPPKPDDPTPPPSEVELQNYANSFNAIIKQFDYLIADASYNDKNLLNGDDVKVVFDTQNLAELIIQGKKSDTATLGIGAASWLGAADIATSEAQIAAAIKTLHNTAAEYAVDFGILQTRQEFTQSLIAILNEGADKLLLADINEESAKMLSRQTAQSLAINALALAAQSAAAILKLF